MNKKLGNKILITVLSVGLIATIITGSVSLFCLGKAKLEAEKTVMVNSESLYPKENNTNEVLETDAKNFGESFDALLENVRQKAESTAKEVNYVYNNKNNYINSGNKVYAPDINSTGYHAQVIYEKDKNPESVQSAVDFSANVSYFLLKTAKEDENIISVFFSSEDGFTVFADNNPKGKFNSKGGVINYNPEWYDWYNGLKAGDKFSYVGIGYDKYGENPCIMCAYPVNNGEFVGSVCVKYAVSDYLESLNPKNGFFVFNKDGEVTYTKNDEIALVAKGDKLSAESAELLGIKEGLNKAFSVTLKGIDGTVSAYKTKANDINIATVVKTADAHTNAPVPTNASKEIYKIIMYFSIILSVIIVLMIIICVRVSKGLSKGIVTPIKRITNGIECVAEGNFQYKVAPDGNNEIRALADSFNNLGARLEKMFENTKLEAHEYEKSNGEFNTSLKIQRDSNMIEFPESDYFEIFAQTKSAKGVCSDFFDAFAVDSTHLGFAIVDTSTSGIDGTITGKIIKELIKAHSVMGESPYEVITNVNAQISEMCKKEVNASVFLGILEINTGKVVFVNAGFKDPLIKRYEGATYDVLKSAGNVRLMSSPDNLYSQESFVLKRGDTLILHSDGITDAVNEAYEKYEQQRLVKALLEIDKKPIDQYLKFVYDDVRQFVKGAPQMDDATMMVIKMNN